MRTYIGSVLAGAFFIGMTTTALAVTGEYDNMCTMGLANGKDIKTDCSVNSQIQGKTYCFGNQSAHPVHGRPFGQSHQGTGLLLEAATWVDQNT